MGNAAFKRVMAIMSACCVLLLTGIAINGMAFNVAEATETTLPYTTPTPSKTPVAVRTPAVSVTLPPVSGTIEPTPTVPSIWDVDEVTQDNWNYYSRNVRISIEMVQEENVTYFVADVLLRDISYLYSGLALDSKGRRQNMFVSEIAEKYNALFAVNGDWYSYDNDGIVIRNGEKIINKPKRAGIAIYNDGSMRVYDEKETSADVLLAQGVLHTYSFGPVLVENGETNPDVTKSGLNSRNPRTGIGQIEPNHFIFIVADGRRTGWSKGITLVDFAKLFQERGCVSAYNLDGGGTATMYFGGRVVNKPSTGSEREISDAVCIIDN